MVVARERTASAVRTEKTIGELLAGGDTRAYAVYQSSAKLGFALARRVKDGDGWLFVDQEVYRLVVQESRHVVRVESQARLEEDFSLRSFRAYFADGPTRFDTEGRMEPGRLVLTVKSAGRA